MLGLLLVVLSQGLRFGLRAASSQAGLQEARADVEPADRAIRAAVAAMDPGTYTEPPRLRAGPDTLAFTTELPSGSGPPQRADVEFFAANGRLMMRWAAHVHAELFRGGAAVHETPLMDNVLRVEFAYAANAAGPFRAQWAAENLPHLIRVAVLRGRAPTLAIVAQPMRERPEE